MKWILVVLIFNLTGCTNKTHKRYEYNPLGRCNDIICLAIAVFKTITNNKFKKCSDMAGNQRKSCESQVEFIKKHISDASK